MLADAENLRFPKLFHSNKTTRTIIIIIIYLENALQLIKAVIKKSRDCIICWLFFGSTSKEKEGLLFRVMGM